MMDRVLQHAALTRQYLQELNGLIAAERRSSVGKLPATDTSRDPGADGDTAQLSELREALRKARKEAARLSSQLAAEKERTQYWMDKWRRDANGGDTAASILTASDAPTLEDLSGESEDDIVVIERLPVVKKEFVLTPHSAQNHAAVGVQQSPAHLFSSDSAWQEAQTIPCTPSHRRYHDIWREPEIAGVELISIPILADGQCRPSILHRMTRSSAQSAKLNSHRRLKRAARRHQKRRFCRRLCATKVKGQR